MRWLLEIALQLPWAIQVPSEVPAQSGRSARLQLAVVVYCEPASQALDCTIEDALVHLEALASDRGSLGEEALWLEEALEGARFEARFDEGVLVGTPDLAGARLDAGSTQLLEDLLGRAALGLELAERPVQRESELGVIPGSRGASAVSALHERWDEGATMAAQGTLRTQDGQVFSMQASSSALLDERGLVERRTWALAQPSASSLYQQDYLLGSVARRLGPDEEPLEGRVSGEVSALDGAAWSLAQGAVWTPELVLDTSKEWLEWGLSLRGAGLVDRRVQYDLSGGGELWLHVDSPIGLGVGLGGAWHLERDHHLFPTAFPVRTHEALLGMHFRPREDLWAPRLGLSWGASFRRYGYANPSPIWIPALSAEIGMERRFERLAVGVFGRGRMDVAPTALSLMGRIEQLDTISLQAGLQLRWEVMTWH